MVQRDFKYKILEHIATISESRNGIITKELNLISFNDKPARIDLRRWNRKTNRMLKGITLTYDELKALKDVLTTYF